jgi:HEPN domain-containing protein
MNAALEQELKDAVAKHLPQAVGEALQARLKQADADAARVESQKSLLGELRGQIDELNKQVRAQKDEISKHIALASREAAVDLRERAAEVSMLTIKLEAANGNTTFARDVAMGLVRNTDFRRTVFDSEYSSTPIIPTGASHQSGTANGNSSRNSTIEETTK